MIKRRRIVVILMILSVLASIISVGASSPPYSKCFEAESEMLSALSEYAKEFPNVSDYINGDISQPKEGYYLEYKEIYIPQINDDYSPIEFSYAESSFGSGVDYLFSSYSKNDGSNNVRFITYYYLSDKEISNKLDSVTESNQYEAVYEGSCNEYPYVAYNSYNENDVFIRCVYEIAVKECYVIVYSSIPYNEEFINGIEFVCVDFSLPVYVKEYASDNEGLQGDVNGDGILSIKDATCIQKHIAGINTLSESGLTLADFDKSGDVNIKDATAIQKNIAGIIA